MSEEETVHSENMAIEAALLWPLRSASILTVVALLLSLAFLGYTAWSGANKLGPVEQHVAHLRKLQDASTNIQNILVRHFETETAPKASEVKQVSDNLRELINEKGNLHPQTPVDLKEARSFLTLPKGNVRTGLLAALSIVNKTLKRENELQNTLIRQTRENAERELILAGCALLMLPLFAMFLIAYLRRNSTRSVGRLIALLENVGNLDFRPAEAVSGNDPLAGVYARYNVMAEKLKAATDNAEQHAQQLESQVRVASETLLQQQEELERSARLVAIGEFAARMAHELRNPISGISIALNNIETELPDGDMRERISLIAEETDRVTRLLNGLLERGKASPERPTKSNLKPLIGDVVRLFDYQLPGNIKINWSATDAECSAPRDTVRQVLINLLRNSKEALGEQEGHIWVQAERRDGMMVFSVEDDGPGYPEQLLTRGIQPFQTEKKGGTGLGMSVIQRLVNAAGGAISLSARADGGARATVTIPCGE